MMGLLGNVAEVEELRPQLMTSEFITVFSDLLYSTSDGIEVILMLTLTKQFERDIQFFLGELQCGWRVGAHRV